MNRPVAAPRPPHSDYYWVKIATLNHHDEWLVNDWEPIRYDLKYDDVDTLGSDEGKSWDCYNRVVVAWKPLPTSD